MHRYGTYKVPFKYLVLSHTIPACCKDYHPCFLESSILLLIKQLFLGMSYMICYLRSLWYTVTTISAYNTVHAYVITCSEWLEVWRERKAKTICSTFVNTFSGKDRK